MASDRQEIIDQKLILLREETVEPLHAAAQLESEGGRILHIYGRRVMIGREPLQGAIVAAPVAEIAADVLESVPEELSETESLGLEAWNFRNAQEFAEAKAARPRADDSWDVYEPPDHESTMHGEATVGESTELLAPVPDMSAFLIGSVAVGLVLVEGPTGDLQFSQAERTKVVAEVQEGLTWLAQQEPRANITWTYDIRTVRISLQPDPSLTGFEPREKLWRDPAMQQLGFSPDFQGVIDYVALLRSNLGTNWGYVAFFTKYPLAHFAYASKPRLVMSFANDGWGLDNIDRVFTHETGHLFGCPDEYRVSGCNCQSLFGFLQERNGNCRSCAVPFQPCLMEANTPALCSFTRIHFGWRDSNGNGVFDPLDT
jgi:hypothetical protein